MYRPFRVNKNIVAIIALSLTSIVMILALGYYEIHVLGNYEVALKCLNRLDDKQSLVEEITNDSQHILQRLMEDVSFDADEISEIKSRDLKITLNMVTLSKSNKTEAEEEAYKALDEAIKDLGTALMPMLLRNDHEALSIEGYHLILRNIMRSVHRYEKILDAQVDTVHNQIAAYFPVAHGNIGFTTLGISFLMLILTAIAIFYTRRYNFKIYDMAHRDKDSGLFTRQYFNEVVDDILAKSSDLRGYALIDIATINEVDGTLGAEVGDQLIADIGSRLSQTELGHEISGRLGGCVFIFLTKPFNSIEALNSDLERIFTLLKQPFVIKGYNITIDLNIGVSIYPMNHLKATALEQMSGNVLHLSKKTGLNRIDYYDDNIKDSISSNIEMSFKLSKALKDGDFYVEYQAIKHRHDSQIVVYEALIRWLDDGVVIPP
ncbi:MAG TPA: hypothetical protein DCS67_09340, partial [Clostridiales bacterium UBA8960]|nr:hypothetical protein [Clostridiales bacterium UBA8960]